MSRYNEEELDRAVDVAMAYEDEEDYIEKYNGLRRSQRREKDQQERNKQKNKKFRE